MGFSPVRYRGNLIPGDVERDEWGVDGGFVIAGQNGREEVRGGWMLISPINTDVSAAPNTMRAGDAAGT